MKTSTIIKLAIRGLNHPATQAYARKTIEAVKNGDTRTVRRAGGFLKKALDRIVAQAKNAVGEEKFVNPGQTVSLRRELFYNPHTQTAGKGYFGNFRKTPMLDLDLPGASHFDRNVIHSNKEQAIKKIAEFLGTPQGKKSLFAAYDTPGGIRLWDLSRRMSPKKYYKKGISEALGDDPDYRTWNVKRGGFATRLSPKPGREGDEVAKFVDYLGSGEAIPENVQEVATWHDNLIRKILESSTKENISLGGLFDLLGK